MFWIVVSALFSFGAGFSACPKGWSLHNDNCYKFILSDRGMMHNDSIYECEKHGSRLVNIETDEEMDYIAALTKRTNNWNIHIDTSIQPSDPTLNIGYPNKAIYNYIMVGAKRDGNGPWYWPVSNSKVTGNQWCNNWNKEPTNAADEHCTFFQNIDPPCIYDAACTGFKWWRYVCEIDAAHPPRCRPNSRRLGQNAECVCDSGYVDVSKSGLNSTKAFQEGEKCILSDPCREVENSLSLLFIMDSSTSIGDKDWKKLVQFVQSGADILTNSTRIGFIKFSYNVTQSGWVKKNWSKQDYIKATPSNYDDSQTNTPAALQEALEMFKSDRSQKKGAILLTDGLPFATVDGSSDGVRFWSSLEEANADSKKAAANLRKAGVDLVIMGFGPELYKHKGEIMDWLADPDEDYFDFKQNAIHLKKIHMSMLLSKACRRFL